ncbi:DUF4232 domain-containing protein [Sinomonas mesophila]|uniref:DUF4232 domain-containing protein n=1 Tax=Sinomonas mesophila TaxID=1531955 RepID=UPI001589598F|nr:DUF4232 domain-containing protein [Sinomonas mesophila]
MSLMPRAAAALAPLLLVAGLAGCGQGTTTGTTSSPSPTTASPTPTGTASPTPSETPSETASPTAGGLARCLSTQLEGSIQPGSGGAAGTVYQKIVLTNVSQAPCLLQGFAGVSLTDGPEGAPIGAPADRDAAAPVVAITLAPGQSGAADFGLTQARNYTDCVVVEAAGFRVYPPEDYGSLFIPAPSTACSNADIHLLTLRAFQPA